MISIIFWSLAAICKAIADNLAHHYYKSVFNKKPISKFWDIAWSNRNPIYLPFTKYKWDAWHVSNSFMIVFCACSAIWFTFKMLHWWYYPAILLIYGGVWNSTFNLFYNKILNKH